MYADATDTGFVRLETRTLSGDRVKRPLVFQEPLGLLKKREKQGPSDFAPGSYSWLVADLPAARNLTCRFLDVHLGFRRATVPHARPTAPF